MSPAVVIGARPAVFFDRDGTLVREVEGALSQPSQLEFLPGAAEAVRRVNQAGWAAVVLTNQSAIARGWMTPFELELVHGALRERMAAEGARLDGILYCPHLDSGGSAPYHRPCACRKPRPGLLLQASERYDLDLTRAWLIGDARRDLDAAAAAGARGILVRTGKGERESSLLDELAPGSRPFAVASGVLEAVEAALGAPARALPQGR